MDAVRIRKAVIFSIRTCYRSVCRHPFLVGMVFFLIFLYRSFPLMFALLVSASPVLVSTAVLLGTLLSFGQPNVPEIEKEETTHEIVSLKTVVSATDANVVERDGSYNVERYTEIRRDVEEKSIEEAIPTANDFSEVDKDDTLADSALLISDKSSELQYDKRKTEEGETEPSDMVLEKKNDLRQGDGEILGNQYCPIQELDERSVDGLENDKLPEGYVGYETVDRISPPGSPWKHEDEGEEEDNDISDSGSDGAESSSPDASMTDIIPLLDELHPLLDEDAPQPAHMSREGSDATSENSPKSFSDGSNELDEDMENHEEELEVGDDEEEEEAHVDKDDETKSAIRWTEDDQKNLTDLGTSELERNQRLENLIARRRLRNRMKLMAEKNLIDLDGVDLPFNVTHISTARYNPFDLPYDPNNDMGLPPIPGSAPSILLPRRNPFDLPYDLSEEKPDLMGDDFQQDVMTLQPKEPFFQRNETFNAGPSFFGTYRHDYKYKPYFVPERMASEGTSYSSLHRQSSELSDSKASSVPETESISSAEDLEDKKPIEEDFSQSQMNSIAEPELIYIAEHPSEHVGHGSESFEDEDSFELGHVEKRDAAVDEIEVKLGDVEDYKEMVSSLSETTAVATPMEPSASEVHLKTEVPEPKYRSSSSFSEVDEEILSEKEGEQLSSSEPLKGDLIEDPSISRQPSTEKLDIDITSQLVDDNHHKEPVYDSSPRALEKNLSSSSICSDLLVEKTGTSSPPVLVKRPLSFTERDPEVSNQSVEKSIPAIEAVEKLVSAHYQPPSEEIPMSQSEKELPLSDQSVNESSPGNPEELQDSTNKLNDLELQEIDDRVQPNTNSLVPLEPMLMQSEVKEIKVPVAVLEDKIIDTVENGEQIQVLEQHTFPVKSTDSHGNMENDMEDVDDVEEINEELLFELDTVGDFSVQHLRSNMTESGGENFRMLLDVGNSSGDVQGDPIVIHETRVTMDDENLRAPRVEEEISKLEGKVEESPEIQMSGTSSIEHVASSIRDIVLREVEDHPTDSKITNDEPLPEETANEPADSKAVQDPNAKVITSDMPDFEVRAIENIEASYKGAEPISAEINVGVGESDTEVGMPVLEAKSFEEIKSAFNQVNENETEKHADSVHAELSPDETVAGYSQHEMLRKDLISQESKSDLTVPESRSIQDGHSAFEQHHEGIDGRLILPGSNGGNLDNAESQDPVGSPLEVHVGESRSAEDTNVALMQVYEANLEKLPMSEIESPASEVNEVRSSKAIESISEISGLVESSSASAEKQPEEVETSEDLRKSDAEHKKANSHRLGSISSSSSSDSDGE